MLKANLCHAQSAGDAGKNKNYFYFLSFLQPSKSFDVRKKRKKLKKEKIRINRFNDPQIPVKNKLKQILARSRTEKARQNFSKKLVEKI